MELKGVSLFNTWYVRISSETSNRLPVYSMKTKYIRLLTGVSVNERGTDMYDDPHFLAVASPAFLFLVLSSF